MSNHHIGHIASKSAEIVKELPPLSEPKSPVIAFGVGLVFGALGIAIYLKSAKDFFICLALFLGLSLVAPGIGSAIGWLFAPVYGAWRAHTSNMNGGW